MIKIPEEGNKTQIKDNYKRILSELPINRDGWKIGSNKGKDNKCEILSEYSMNKIIKYMLILNVFLNQ